jgi:hypothetical protein
MLLALASCAGGGSGPDAPTTEATRTTAAAPTSAPEVGADGFPAGFAYPQGATVKSTAPAHSLYIVAGTDVDAVKDHWKSQMSSLGFELADTADGSVTYQRGSTTIQITWGQAGAEIRGAANVLTP